MNTIVDITTLNNGVILNFFDPSGTDSFYKVSYPKKEVAFIEYKLLVDINIICITGGSANFTTPQIICIANKNKPSVIKEQSLLLVRNWNGVEVNTTEELFELITNFVNS